MDLRPESFVEAWDLLNSRRDCICEDCGHVTFEALPGETCPDCLGTLASLPEDEER